ncbi:MAG: glycine dehydrogenase [Cytophagales bacterium]|nr:glycine dehydrogenase [Cytophagales bacterium]
MRQDFTKKEKFVTRHNGPGEESIKKMLNHTGVDSLDQLIEETIPAPIRLKKALQLPEAQNEFDFLRSLKKLAGKNKLFKPYIGMGYYDCIVPEVIKRNILENPGWYTAYTPYQAEIAQGRLEALINFQTMVMDLTGMELANASLLDEATAAAEAMAMMFSLRKGDKKNANLFLVSKDCFPQTIDVLQTRALPLGIELLMADHNELNLDSPSPLVERGLGGKVVFGALLQYPDANGAVYDYSDFISKAHEKNILIAVAADILSLTLFVPPGEMGADVVVGSTQRFGVPMGYGGPHAAYFATKEAYKRYIPGRIIGASLDADGNKAYRMALQTREQHIRREKATSNICTAQVLLAIMAGMYAVYHGPEGLKTIGERIHGYTKLLEKELTALGYNQINNHFFDTLKIDVGKIELLRKIALESQINFRYFDDHYIGISLNETTEISDINDIINVFDKAQSGSKFKETPKLGVCTSKFKPEISNLKHLPAKGLKQAGQTSSDLNNTSPFKIPDSLKRRSPYLTHPVFNRYHTEHEMLRYLKRLENKDLSLVHSMISLGSCTMKLNATAEMVPVTWAEFANLHPFVPLEQAQGYMQLFTELEVWLCSITGFAAISFQPNSGAQGEFTGLLVIRALHQSKGDGSRNIALIPSSAHGTNPASAVMAGMKVIIVACDRHGNIDLNDLVEKVEFHKDNLAALMITYPSTHGVFEDNIKEVCRIIHDNGGQVYMDGANLNAQLGLTSPAEIGADVCHLNLHKTFCIPHGGGGPGMGPIGVAKHLAPFLPAHQLIHQPATRNSIHSVSSSPWSSASILPITYAYIAMMGAAGLTEATKIAILNANYIKSQLEKYYPILYTAKNGRCAHEFIVDCRQFKEAVGIEVEDIAKRLMDYGFHAPTVSFPVPGTLMIEPTESESVEELDRFCEAMIAIRKEIQEIEDDKADRDDNVLKNAPHTAQVVMADEWDHNYSRQKAAYPLDWVKQNKFWPTVSRIDSAYGDRNLVCGCLPVEEYEKAVV